MSNTKLIASLQSVYDSFMTSLDIDPKTGILGLITNPRCKDREGKVRFSGYPFVGSQYDSSSPKILVVGLDIGVDELRDTNSFHTFESRNHCIEPSKQSENTFNIHFSGTYGVVLFLLKDHYGWEQLWEEYFAGKEETFEGIINKYGPTILPFEVISRVAFTNIHKFVNINRIKRSGDSNRRWYCPGAEKELFKKEVQLFAPDIVYIQGKSSFDGDLLNWLKEGGYRLVLSDHPSSWRNGANKPTYVDKLNLINW